MSERRQEKMGWIGGWLGGFIWVFILSIVFFVQAKTLHATIGILITAAGCASILFLSPWRHPQTPYRTLMIPIYLLFVAAIAWGVWSTEDLGKMGISWWTALVLLPALMPLWTTGNRRWEE